MQLVLIVIGIVFSIIGLMLIIKKFSDDTNGEVKLFGIEVKGPSKLIILVIGVAIIITGAKTECKNTVTVNPTAASKTTVSSVYWFYLKPFEEFKISRAGKPSIYFFIDAWWRTDTKYDPYSKIKSIGFWIGTEPYTINDYGRKLVEKNL